MRRPVELAVWALAGVAGLALLIWAFPRTFVFYPEEWSVNRAEATALALERFRDLGEPVEDALVVPVLEVSSVIESRLQQSRGQVPIDRLRSSRLNRVQEWAVLVYPPAARPSEWRYRANVSPDGRVTQLNLRISQTEELPDLDPAEARRRADAFLADQGFDLETFGEPVVRLIELTAHSRTSLRYPDAELILGDEQPYGVEVTFAGDVLTGFDTFHDDPGREAILASLQPINLWMQVRIMTPFLLFPFVAAFFLRRYHAGDVGVRRLLQIFGIGFGSGVLLFILGGFAASEGVNFGLLSRRQVAWAWGIQLIIFWVSSISLLAALSWSVGEAQSRERWPGKLAAFDALFKGGFDTATVARSSLRGVCAGFATVGLLVFLLPHVLPGRHGMPTLGASSGPFWSSAAWPGLALLCFTVVYGLYTELFARLFLLSTLERRLGRWAAGILVALVSSLLFWPMVSGTTATSSIVLGFIAAAVLVVLFLRYDLLTALTAALVGSVAVSVTPYLLSDDAFLQFQGVLPLFLLSLPLLLSVRHLFSGEEFVYRYEDVPPHVRRIAERERQRVELETARRIQSSILPDLPESLNGVQLAHAYLPASEVGGDFYDVLALEDGRLAVAVGDVAGHGVSSGLVMSMAKSALAVQVTFSPDVADVFRTLNRTVYQTARKRLLATLCYAIVDPVKMEMLYASAGHLFPYRISPHGKVEALESVSYPLGVRETVEMLPKEAHLDPGDTLFLFSDGIVEAHGEGSDDLFGFERLEDALARHAHLPPNHLRDAILEEVDRFTGPVPREDDQTVLVLRLPE